MSGELAEESGAPSSMENGRQGGGRGLNCRISGMMGNGPAVYLKLNG